MEWIYSLKKYTEISVVARIYFQFMMQAVQLARDTLELTRLEFLGALLLIMNLCQIILSHLGIEIRVNKLGFQLMIYHFEQLNVQMGPSKRMMHGGE